MLAGSDGWGAREALRRDHRERRRDPRHSARLPRVGNDRRAVPPGGDDRVSVVEEGFGLPALEGLACGAPVVTTQGSALAEVVADAAVLVPPGDDDALARAIERILDEPGLARAAARGRSGRAAAFTWTACVDAHVEAYRHAAVVGART